MPWQDPAGFGEQQRQSHPHRAAQLHPRDPAAAPGGHHGAHVAGAPQPGINDYASRSAMLLHILLHASGTLLGRTARLLHLHDIARLTATMGPADWDELFRQAQGSSDPQLWWAYPPLLLSDRYFGCVPRAVLERLGRACHWQLRRAYRRRTLSDVSLSLPVGERVSGDRVVALAGRGGGLCGRARAPGPRDARAAQGVCRVAAVRQRRCLGAHLAGPTHRALAPGAATAPGEPAPRTRIARAPALLGSPMRARRVAGGVVVAHSAELHGQHGNRATVDALDRIADGFSGVHSRPSRTAAAGSVRAWGSERRASSPRAA